jgi:hypothetical protein
MSHTYYNQYNYPNTPYPSPTLPNATVKSGGCGVCSAAMIVSSLCSKKVNPVEMAAYAMKKGARVVGGTDMNTLAKAISQDYGLSYETTSDETKLLEHLKTGGMAIGNVGGNRSGWTGVFSSAGHFIVIAACEDTTAAILDPGYYSGKFERSGRSGKVRVSGNYCYCDISVLAADTANRSPAYWLFKKTNVLDNTPDNYAKQSIEWAIEQGLLKGDESGDYKLHSQINRQNLLVILHRYDQLKKEGRQC